VSGFSALSAERRGYERTAARALLRPNECRWTLQADELVADHWSDAGGSKVALAPMREARAEALRALATAADRRLGPGWRQRADGAVPIPLLSLLDEQTAAAIEAYVDAWCAVASVLLDEKGQFGGASSDLLQQDTLRVRSAGGQLQRLIGLPTHPWLLGCLLEFQRRMAQTFSGKKGRRLPLAEDEVRKLVPGAILEAWFVYEEGHARPLAYADGAAFHLELLRLSSSKPMDFMPFTQLPAAQGRDLARDPAQALGLANELVAEMDRRIDTIARAWCDDIGDYNSEHPADRLPYVVAVFDEFSEMAASFADKSDRTAFESASGHERPAAGHRGHERPAGCERRERDVARPRAAVPGRVGRAGDCGAGRC